MDNNVADNVQDVENGNEGDQAMEDCLRNPLIVRNILEHFTSKELLQISLVNKLWKHEARSAVRKRGNIIANLGFNQRRYEKHEVVEAFVSDVPQMNDPPFSGIRICQDSNPSPAAALLPIYEANFDQLPLKSVSVEIFARWLEFMDCPALLLVKKVSQQFCGVLKELQLNITNRQGSFIEKVLWDCNFPRLKILKVHAAIFDSSNEDIGNYMKALLSRAPNLKMLHTNWNINSTLQLLQGTSVRFVYTTYVRAPFDEITENVISAIRLDNMELEYTGLRFDFERFNRIAPVLLQASCTKTLREMSMDAVLAVSLMCFGIRLENVKCLHMEIDHSRLEQFDPRILRIVKKFDFALIFPNLDVVNLEYDNNVSYLSPDHINAVIQQVNAVSVLREPKLDRAVHIKKLFLIRWNPSSVAAQFFVEMFPSIEKLEILASAGKKISYESIANWLCLKEIELRGHVLPTTGNLDNIFCGVFPEEIAELREKDDEYLKKVNIVPVMPAVTSMRNLRTLSLYHKDYRRNPHYDDENFVFSKVATLLAFARQPALTVSLNISARAAPPKMTQLKPYVSVTSDLLKDSDEDWGD